ncbi:6-pyruvoyl-tetrahydropterin synthase-related protein [Clostridium baratii]|uniref:6-pyruvoyl-tetrahydropterin synthase-related protein n=1 Tax=Clostridium baratii TaxID=1561 RepID=UPI0030CE4E53
MTKEIIKNKKESQLYIYIILIIATGITLLPMLLSKPIRGDDYFFHLLRIEDIKNGLSYGQFPVNIMSETLYGYGYGNGIFYPDLLLYFAAIIRLFGVSLFNSYKIFMSVCTLLATFIMYFSARRILKSNNKALYISIFYVFAQYKITDLYVRAAVGEYLAFIFLPIVILGVYELVYKDYKKWYILTIGMSGIVLSHLLSVFIVSIMCALLYILNIGKLIKDPKRILYSILAAITTVLLTSYTLIPIIEQMISSKFSVQEVEPFAYNKSTVFKELFTVNTVMIYSLGYVLLFLALIYIFVLFKKKNRFVTTCFIAGSISFILTLKTPLLHVISNNISIYNSIQFAWRLNLIATPLLAIAIGYSVDELMPKNINKTIVVILISIISIIPLMITVKYIKEKRIKNIDFTKFTQNYNAAIGAGEYMPEGASKEKLKKRGSIVTSNDKEFKYDNYRKKGTLINLDYKVSKDGSYIELPLLYYKGYTFEITSKDGGEIKEGQATHGKDMVVRVNLGNIKEGHLKVNYTATTLMKVGDIVTIITLIFMIIYIIKRNRENDISILSLHQ